MALFVIRYDVCVIIINTLFISSFAYCNIEIYSLICKPEKCFEGGFFQNLDRVRTGYGGTGTVFVGFSTRLVGSGFS